MVISSGNQPPSSKLHHLTKKKKNYYLILTALGLHCCTWACSSCSKQRLLSNCGAQVSHCGGFFCRKHSLSVHGLQCSWCTDSDSVVAHGFGYPTACRLFPGQGLDMTPALTGRFLTSGPQGKSFITSAASAEVWLKGASYK